MRASVERRGVPEARFNVAAIPLGMLELVLHIEEPDPERGRDQGDRKVHQEEQASGPWPRSGAAAAAAIPKFVPIGLSQGRHPRPRHVERKAVPEQELIGRPADRRGSEGSPGRGEPAGLAEGDGIPPPSGCRDHRPPGVEIAVARVVGRRGTGASNRRASGSELRGSGRSSRSPRADGRRRHARNRAGSGRAATGTRPPARRSAAKPTSIQGGWRPRKSPTIRQAARR